jgi:polysaccharide export outer membrane protein
MPASFVCRLRCVLLGMLAAAGMQHAEAQSSTPANNNSTEPRQAVTYTLTNTDKLSISVFQEDDLNVIARVDAKGFVNLKLVGDVRVFGLSVSEAQKAIEDAYKDGRFLRNPQVTINIEEYAPREVTVYGMVREPKRVPLPTESNMNLVDLIGKVGGFTDTARGNAVTVTRITPEGKRIVLGPFDVESMNKGKDRGKAGENVLIMMPGDIVNVPQRIF